MQKEEAPLGGFVFDSLNKLIFMIEKIIKIASNENDLVLDCFYGVGSTGVAALKNNRRYIGIEIDNTYMKATEKRLKDF